MTTAMPGTNCWLEYSSFLLLSNHYQDKDMIERNDHTAMLHMLRLFDDAEMNTMAVVYHSRQMHGTRRSSPTAANTRETI
jgi:hypothetical protein